MTINVAGATGVIYGIIRFYTVILCLLGTFYDFWMVFGSFWSFLDDLRKIDFLSFFRVYGRKNNIRENDMFCLGFQLKMA